MLRRLEPVTGMGYSLRSIDKSDFSDLYVLL